MFMVIEWASCEALISTLTHAAHAPVYFATLKMRPFTKFDGSLVLMNFSFAFQSDLSTHYVPIFYLDENCLHLKAAPT